MNDVQAMIEMICSHQQGLDFIVGSRDQKEIQRIAEQWDACGFTVQGASDYLAAGVFDAESADTLHNVGISAESVDVPSDRFAGYTVGYAFANGDMNIDQVKAALAKSPKD